MTLGLGVEILPHPIAKRAAEGVLAAFCSDFVREIPEDAGERPIIRFIGTAKTEDRYGSVIAPLGVKMTHFRANPVFMQFHDYHRWPLGRSLTENATATAIAFDIEFAVEQYEEAALAYRMYRDDFVRGVSIGIIPIASEPYEAKTIPSQWAENKIYTESELLELSAAPIPANRNALKMALEKGTYSENELKAFGLDRYLIFRDAPYVLFSQSIVGARHVAENGPQGDEVPPEDETPASPIAPESAGSSEVPGETFSLDELRARGQEALTHFLEHRDATEDCATCVSVAEACSQAFEQKPAILRAGAVLNRANREALEQAATLIAGVIASAAKQADESNDDDVTDRETPADEPTVQHAIDCDMGESCRCGAEPDPAEVLSVEQLRAAMGMTMLDRVRLEMNFGAPAATPAGPAATPEETDLAAHVRSYVAEILH